MRDALLAAGAAPETAEHNSRLHAYAFRSGVMGVLNDDILKVTGRPPVSFAEFAVGAAAAWRRQAPEERDIPQKPWDGAFEPRKDFMKDS